MEDGRKKTKLEHEDGVAIQQRYCATATRRIENVRYKSCSTVPTASIGAIGGQPQGVVARDVEGAIALEASLNTFCGFLDIWMQVEHSPQDDFDAFLNSTLQRPAVSPTMTLVPHQVYRLFFKASVQDDPDSSFNFILCRLRIPPSQVDSSAFLKFMLRHLEVRPNLQPGCFQSLEINLLYLTPLVSPSCG
jgi:hypothetical protein